MNLRDAVLADNQDKRNGGFLPKRFDWGYAALRIPTEDYAAIVRLYPELTAHDADVRFKAWQRFASGPFAEPYRVVRSGRQVQRSQTGIIVR